MRVHGQGGRNALMESWCDRSYGWSGVKGLGIDIRDLIRPQSRVETAGHHPKPSRTAAFNPFVGKRFLQGRDDGLGKNKQ